MHDPSDISLAIIPSPCFFNRLTYRAPAKCILTSISGPCEGVRIKKFVCTLRCVSECAHMFFRACYHSAADLSLFGASTQMFGHRPFSERSSGICSDKHSEKFTQDNKTVMSDGGNVILRRCVFRV